MDQNNKDKEKVIKDVFGWEAIVNATTNISSMSVHIADLVTKELYYMNEAGFRMAGKESCDYRGKKCYEVLFGSDHPCENCRMDDTKNGITVHETTLADTGHTYLINSQILNWDDTPIYIEYTSDITKQKEERKKTEDWYLKQIDIIMHAYPDALGSLLMNLTKDYVSSQRRLYSFIQE